VRPLLPYRSLNKVRSGAAQWGRAVGPRLHGVRKPQRRAGRGKDEGVVAPALCERVAVVQIATELLRRLHQLLLQRQQHGGRDLRARTRARARQGEKEGEKTVRAGREWRRKAGDVGGKGCARART
jgi:hypothetical protein